MHTDSIITLALAAATVLVGCAKGDSSAAADSTTPATSTSAPGAPAAGSTTAASSSAPGDTIVRGTLASVSDTALAVRIADGGDVRVTLTPPVQVYARELADLSKVTERAFVGVTSVPQPDGTQRATEIHIFPEELRGLGEGSRPMGPAGGGTRPSTMTNGAVAPNAASGAGSRMTNGAVRAPAGGALTVEYQGGSQTITVPAGVTVTAIAPTATRLTPGASVIVLGRRQSDGTLQSSRVMLAPPARARP